MTATQEKWETATQLRGETDRLKELADWSTAPNWSVSSITRKTEKKDDN